LFYTTVYAITLLGAFGVVAVVRRVTGGDDFADFSGLWMHSPLLAGCMAVFMLSLAGIPPLAGFFGKFYLFSAAVGAGTSHGLLWLVVVALFGSLISLYYYLVVLKVIFVDAAAAETSPKSESYRIDFLQRGVIVVLAAAVLFLGILPETLAARIIASLP
jgi:NADH-quinone oxidoreductase subunit N